MHPADALYGIFQNQDELKAKRAELQAKIDAMGVEYKDALSVGRVIASGMNDHRDRTGAKAWVLPYVNDDGEEVRIPFLIPTRDDLRSKLGIESYSEGYGFGEAKAWQKYGVAVDCETTGLDPLTDAICAVAITSLTTGETRRWFVNPGQPSHPAALAVHKLDEAFLADKPDFAEIAGEVAKALCEGDMVVGHNIGFDLSMLKTAFVNANRERAWKGTGIEEAIAERNEGVIVDTAVLCRAWHELPKVGLDACLRHFDMSRTGAKHEAGEDAELSRKLLLALVS